MQVPVLLPNTCYGLLVIYESFFGTFAALLTLKHLLQKNVKCRNLLENDAGGGSVSGSIAVSSCYTIVHELTGLLPISVCRLMLTISNSLFINRNFSHMLQTPI